eukprot:4314683-Alexandrium_andersonii.AAC.1
MCIRDRHVRNLKDMHEVESTQVGEDTLQATLQESYEEVGMKPGGGQGRQAADAAKEFSAASQAAEQGQLAPESTLLQGQPVLGAANHGQASSCLLYTSPSPRD